MFQQETIKQIRGGATDLVLVFLVTLYDDKGVIYRLNSSSEDIVSKGNTYNKFHFRVELPTESPDNTSQISIIFPNFSTDIKISEILKATRCQIAVFDKNFPDDAIFPNRELFIVGYNKNISEAILTFTTSFIRDKRFPFKNYNSIDHPRLYER